MHERHLEDSKDAGYVTTNLQCLLTPPFRYSLHLVIIVSEKKVSEAVVEVLEAFGRVLKVRLN